MLMDRDGIHSSRDEHEGKEETCGDATARSTTRELTRTRVTRPSGVLRIIPYLRNTFAASATTSWRAAVAAVSGVPALTTPNFGDHAASTVRWSIASPRMVRARAPRSAKRDL